jgi:hypothetical protein
MSTPTLIVGGKEVPIQSRDEFEKTQAAQKAETQPTKTANEIAEAAAPAKASKQKQTSGIGAANIEDIAKQAVVSPVPVHREPESVDKNDPTLGIRVNDTVLYVGVRYIVTGFEKNYALLKLENGPQHETYTGPIKRLKKVSN